MFWVALDVVTKKWSRKEAPVAAAPEVSVAQETREALR